LVLPWFEISGRSRSSIDLISSANALEIIDGSLRLLIVGLWLLLPVLAAAALIAYAARRSTLAATLTLVVGISVLATVVVGGVVDAVGLAWGAWLAAVFGTVAVLCAMMVIGMARRPT